LLYKAKLAMPTLYDLGYATGLGLAAPVWLALPKARRKVLEALRNRMAHDAASSLHPGPAPADATCILIHAVSVGEINATKQLVDRLTALRPGLRFVITATTLTGLARGTELYAKHAHVRVVRFPLDFSGAVDRLLDAARPDLVVLMELEVWPNFLARCTARQIPVMLANGRITESSHDRYTWLGPVSRHMFRRLAWTCAQDQLYANRFMDLGTDPKRTSVVGTMKFDNATVGETVPGAEHLAEELGLFAGVQPIWVCGSTGPGEEQLILRAYRNLLRKFPRLRLAIIPRKPERFDEVAALIEQFRFKCVRRSSRLPVSTADDPAVPPVVLGDTMGELRKFYALADYVFVGRSLVDLGEAQRGSDMIEPAALARPIIIGHWTHNFAEAMRLLHRADAVLEVGDGDELEQAIRVLISTPNETAAMGRRAQQVVIANQGATDRHVQVILQLLNETRIDRGNDTGGGTGGGTGRADDRVAAPPKSAPEPAAAPAARLTFARLAADHDLARLL
jgi:3-deoxy-D-manno-octulosonic-acid transferase